MTRHPRSVRTISILALACGVAGGLWADDRVLLRAEGAPPNVLLILDSGASMTHDAERNQLYFPAGGDDDGRYVDYMGHVYGTSWLESQYGSQWQVAVGRGSKLVQSKRALHRFFNAGFDFNFGFTFYEKTAISIAYVDYIYSVKAMKDTNGDGVDDTAQTAMLDGTPVGGPMRMGDTTAIRGSNPPAFPVRYGPDGTDQYVLWDTGAALTTPGGGSRALFYDSWSDVEPVPHVAGDRRIVSYLVTSNSLATAQAWSSLTEAQRIAGNYYYYPAYDWTGVTTTTKNGLEGSASWTSIAAGLGLDTSDPQGTWLATLHDAVIEDIETKANGSSNQIGSQVLHIREDLEVYDGSSWAPSQSRITDVGFEQNWVLYDHDPAETGNVKDSRSAMDYVGQGGDCRGYLESGVQDEPIVPISRPNASTGATADKRWLIDTYLQSQSMPVFYFPNNAVPYLPTVRDNFVPLTEGIAALGRRPIKDSLTEAGRYIADVRAWDDPLAACRMDFVILITDGMETCSNTNAPCVHASQLGSDNIPVYVIYLGTDDNVQAADQTVIKCVATNSGGTYFQAGNEEEFSQALLRIAMDIEERTRGFASPIVPSVETSTEQTAYLSTFTPKDGRSVWRGHIRSYLINPVTGVISDLRADGTPDPSKATWDAGDQLATRAASDREIYYGTNGSGSVVPGVRLPFDWSDLDGGTAPETLKRTWLGNRVFYPASWTDSSDEKAALHATINFVRGVTMVIDDSTDPPTITTYGRNPLDYGWCGATDDEEFDAAPEPCDEAGATVVGIEKLGDTFHSTPQLLSSPRCYPCWRQNYHGYRDDTNTITVDDGFFTTHKHRRQVLFAGADDGALHAFDAGLWDPDGATIDGTTKNPQYDSGSGRELFAWVPTTVMNRLDSITFGADHRWTVDGTPTLADVFVDPSHNGTPTDADREWRTVAIFGERRGGRSYVCLDVTQPDPYDSEHDPVSPAIGDLTIEPATAAASSDRDPICASGLTSGCNGKWPELRWEFTDTSDEDSNLADDLGQTWSRPLVGFVHVDTGGLAPEDRMVAFFGGGFSPDGVDAVAPSGNFVYGVDIETGTILLKEQVLGMVPGDVAGLDLDLDGFLEKLYFATTAGRIYRIDLGTGVVDATSHRVESSWDPVLVFDAGATQPFFMRPTLVPISFAADGSAELAIAIGSGNRDNILEPNTTPHRFYVVVDKPKGGGGPITEADMTGLTLASSSSGSNYLLGSSNYGWYLALSGNAAFTPPHDDWEKVNTAALVLDQKVIFSTFNPSAEVDVVDIFDDDGNKIGTACRHAGTARTYTLLLTNGNPAEGAERFEEHEGAAMATEPVVYLGADGELHVIQALDDLKIEEPIGSIAVPVRVMSWKEE